MNYLITKAEQDREDGEREEKEKQSTQNLYLIKNFHWFMLRNCFSYENMSANEEKANSKTKFIL